MNKIFEWHFYSKSSSEIESSMEKKDQISSKRRRHKIKRSGSQEHQKARLSDLFDAADVFDTISSMALKSSPMVDISALPTPSVDDQSIFQEFVFMKSKRGMMKRLDAIEQLQQMTIQANSDFISNTDRFKEANSKIGNISKHLKLLKLKNIKFGRNFLRFEIAHALLVKDFWDSEIQRCRNNIDNCASFITFLGGVGKDYQFVDLKKFIPKYFLDGAEQYKIFKKHSQILNLKIQSLQQQQVPVNQNDIVNRYFDQKTKVSAMMNRFRVIIDKIRYPDLEVIAEAVGEIQNEPINEVIDHLFEIAWYFRMFPICDRFTLNKIPNTNSLIPKVFAPPFLDDKWNYMTFLELSASDWPLKPAVDALFEMMVLTNPFQMGRKFYDIIQLIGKCVQDILKSQNKSTKYVDIDFDQLFVLMLLCVFTSGLNEIVLPFTYCYKFRDFMMDNYQIQFATSHMEAICMHVRQIDWKDTKKKSDELRKKRKIELKEKIFSNDSENETQNSSKSSTNSDSKHGTHVEINTSKMSISDIIKSQPNTSKEISNTDTIDSKEEPTNITSETNDTNNTEKVNEPVPDANESLASFVTNNLSYDSLNSIDAIQVVNDSELAK
ncbi:hypothetical protein TRFO_12032 [Tritrichomonas foetus]|uniref:VPS9 domain-containing protein n=1 Tax=Tritrichomonas foetus TaxID=1144522 RepID=A0A1J4J1B3_9EUKA|nr:hypothetical protein TRFO_12032 [Tritrichomonas foetus]|eukprot:OHS93202.1 hypothetical protein TRFO_12032 [Tritrichomonas foetus]